MGAIQKLGENSICNAVKLLSVGDCEKYMTARFILHSPFMLESMMASGKRGHSEQCTPIESQCIASHISHFYADTSVALLWQKERRKTIISKWVSIMYFSGFIHVWTDICEMRKVSTFCWEKMKTIQIIYSVLSVSLFQLVCNCMIVIWTKMFI